MNALDFIAQHGYVERYYRGSDFLIKSLQYPSTTLSGQIASRIANMDSVSKNTEVVISTKLKTSAGRAYADNRGGTITLHHLLIKDSAAGLHLEETFFHELAHIIAIGQWHNGWWQFVFNCFGFVPTRCHNISWALSHQRFLSAAFNDLLGDEG